MKNNYFLIFSDKRKKQTSESNTSTSGRDNDQDDIQDTFALDPELSDVDLNFDDEDETMRECYKIFNEYKPEPIKPQFKIEECPKMEPEDDVNVRFYCSLFMNNNY